MEESFLATLAQRIRSFADPGDHHALYDHQVEMLDAIATHLESGQSNGTIKAATGTGKTYALGAMAVASGVRTVIITPRKLVGDQAFKTFMDPEKFNIDAASKVGIYDSAHRDKKHEDALDKDILITTYASFVSLVRRGKISADPADKNFYGNIILDEAHRGTGPEFSKVIAPFLDHSVVTAWTATDTFVDGSNVGERLFGRQDRIYTMELQEAVRRGLLTNAIHAVGVEVGVEAEDIEALKKKNKDYPARDIEKFAQMEAVQEKAVEMYMNYVHPSGVHFRDKPCIVNTLGVTAAEQTAARFNAALGEGSAVVVSGQTPKKLLRNEEHTGILDRFDSGEIKVLCAADLLIEGFDSKDVSLVFSLRPSMSPWLVEQMLGRGARKQSESYFDRFGHDKQLIAVNFFGQGMRPLLFSDIIHGATLEPPEQRFRLPGGMRVTSSYQPNLGLETPLRIFATTSELASLHAEWDAAKSSQTPPKPDYMVSISGAYRRCNTVGHRPKGKQVSDVFEECQRQYQDPERKGPVMYQGKPVECGYYSYPGVPDFFAVDAALFERLKLAGTAPPKPDNMLGIAAYIMKAHTRLGPESVKGKLIESIFERCEEQFNDPARKGPVMIDGVEIECGYFRSSQWTVFCLHEDSIAKLGIAARPDNMLALSDFVKKVRVGKDSTKGKAIRAMFEACEKQFDDPGRKGPVMYQGVEINCGKYKRGSKPFFYMDEAVIDALGLKLQDRPEDMLAYSSFSVEAGKKSNDRGIAAIFAACEKQFDDPARKGKPVVYNGVEVDCGRFMSGATTPFCISKSMIAKLVPTFPEKTENMLSYHEFCKLARISPGTDLGKRIASIFTECQAKVDDPKHKGPVKVNGVEVRCGWFKGHLTSFCLDKSMIAALGFEIKDKPETMLGLIESHTRVGVTNASATGNAIRAAYLACEEQFDDPARQGKPVMYNGVAVECGRFRLSGQPIFCFSEKSIEQLGWKKVPVKDDNMLGFREFCDQKTIPVSSPLGLEIKALYEACERQFNDPNRKGPVVCDDVEINCGAFKSFSRPVFCIAAAQLDHIKAKAAQRLGARAEGGSFAEDVTPRSIAPDALHIQSAGKAGMDRSSSQ